MAEKLMRPAELRVTFKRQHEGGTYSHDVGDWVGATELAPLGFAHAYEPNLKTFASKQRTQDTWAYDNHFYNEEGLVVRTEHRWTRKNGQSECVTFERPVPEHLQPRIIANLPRDGFQLVKSVSRYSTSNKLWRVLDPGGFELEISTSNLEDLMMDCVIDHGIIKSTCVWYMPRGKAYLMRADIL